MTSTVVSTKYIMVLHCVKQNYEKYLLIKYFYTFFFLFEKIPRLKIDISTRLSEYTPLNVHST